MGKRPFVIAFVTLVIGIFLRGYIFGVEPIYDDSFGDEDSIACVLSGDIFKITKSQKNIVLWIESDEFDKVIVYLDRNQYDSSEIHPGNTFKGEVKLSKISHSKNEGSFDSLNYYYYSYKVKYSAYAKKFEIDDSKTYYICNALYKIKEKLILETEQIYDDKDAGVVKAMLYGDKSSLDSDIKEKYSSNGIAHILAISGLHVSILGGILYFCMLKLTSSMKIATIFSCTVIVLYGVMTGFSVSTNRAVLMMIIAMLGKMLGRTYDLPNAIGLSGVIILMRNPYQIYTSGFWLSFLAVTAICTMLPINEYLVGYIPDDGAYIRNKKILGEWKARNNIYSFADYFIRIGKSSLITSFSVSIITLPVVLKCYYEIQLLSILINIIVVPFMSIIVGAAFFSTIVSCFNLQIGIFLGGCVHYILRIYSFMCELADIIGVKPIVLGCPSNKQIVIYYIGLIIIVIAVAYKKKNNIKINIGTRKVDVLKNKGYILLFMVAYAYCVFCPKMDGKLHIDMLDIGQGDAICIRAPNGKALLVDGGSSSQENVGNTIVDYYKFHGYSQINDIYISHFDEDHISGIKQIIDEKLFQIDKILIPKVNLPNEKYKEFCEYLEKNDLKVEYVSRGDKIACDKSNVEFEILNPNETKLIEDDNEYSMVFILRYKDFKMMFTGDIGSEQEKSILEYGQDRKINLSVNVLKCAHHGSKNSNSESFIEKLRPSVAIISAGKNNRYGHPSKDVLERLKEKDIKFFVTIKSSQICLESDGSSYNIKEYAKRNK